MPLFRQFFRHIRVFWHHFLVLFLHSWGINQYLPQGSIQLKWHLCISIIEKKMFRRSKSWWYSVSESATQNLSTLPTLWSKRLGLTLIYIHLLQGLKREAFCTTGWSPKIRLGSTDLLLTQFNPLLKTWLSQLRV